MLLKFSSFKILNLKSEILNLIMLSISSFFKIINQKSAILNLFLSVISLYSLLFAGAPDTLWTRTYGGKYYDGGYSVQQTNDNGFIISGYTENSDSGNADIYLIRTDSIGDTLWTKTYGGDSSDCGMSVKQTSDGGFIIAGTLGCHYAKAGLVILIRTNSQGDTLWTKSYGGDSCDVARSIQNTSDGGFIITGWTNSFGAGGSDVYLIRTNSNGDTLWTRTYGGANWDDGYSVQQTGDGGFIITGETFSYGAGRSNIYLLRTNSNGDTLWTKAYGESGDNRGHSVLQTNDGGFVITGSTESYSANEIDVYLIRTDSNGDTLWIKLYGVTSNASIDDGWSVKQTNDGGYIIAGRTCTDSGWVDVYVIRTDSNGDTIWTKIIGGTGLDWGWSIQQLNDGGFIITGHTSSFGAGKEDVYLIRLGKETIGIQDDNSSSFINPNDFIVSYNNNNLISIRYTIQYSSPVNLSMYNISGQLIKTLFNEYKNAGDYTINFNTDNISAGLYYFKLYAGKSSYTQEAVVIK